MKIVFFGNSKYSSIAAQVLQEKLKITLVVTNPDKPAGRKRQLRKSPVKQFAQKNNLPVITYDKLDKEAIASIAKAKPDFLVVSDYGLILPKELLTLPKYKALNIHHSLLPKYRGPSPAPATILAGEKNSGATIIEMTEKVDAGDILVQKKYTLADDETTDSLLTTLNTLGGQLVVRVIDQYLKGKVKPQKQNESQASFTHRLKKEDGYIDLENPPDPKTLDRMIRALYPWPGVWTRLQTTDYRLQTIKFLPNLNYPTTQPSNYLTNFLIQPEGKRPMTILEFRNGYPELFKQLNKLFATEQKQSQTAHPNNLQ